MQVERVLFLFHQLPGQVSGLAWAKRLGLGSAAAAADSTQNAASTARLSVARMLLEDLWSREGEHATV